MKPLCDLEGQKPLETLTGNPRSKPADCAAFRVDFRRWLSWQGKRDQAIVEAFAAGYRTQEVARAFRLTQGRISNMRREFAESWEEFHQPRQSRQLAAV